MPPGIISALTVAGVLTVFSSAIAAPTLRDADVQIIVTSPTACDVRIALTVDGASEIDHRLEMFRGSRTELIDVRGAQRVGELRTIGRTQSLVLKPEQSAYEFSYRVRQPEGLAHRCPIWLPAVPTDGRSRAVQLHVELPPGATAGGSMPALAWTGTQGSARLGHLPAFVRVPYGADGASPGWSIGRVMDAVALMVFIIASAIWAWRKKR